MEAKMADLQHLQNVAAAMAAGAVGSQSWKFSPEAAAKIYFSIFDALMDEDNNRAEQHKHDETHEKKE